MTIWHFHCLLWKAPSQLICIFETGTENLEGTFKMSYFSQRESYHFTPEMPEIDQVELVATLEYLGCVAFCLHSVFSLSIWMIGICFDCFCRTSWNKYRWYSSSKIIKSWGNAAGIFLLFFTLFLLFHEW